MRLSIYSSRLALLAMAIVIFELTLAARVYGRLSPLEATVH